MDLRKTLSCIHHQDPFVAARLGFPTQYYAAGTLSLKLHKTRDQTVLSVEGRVVLNYPLIYLEVLQYMTI